MFQNGTNKTFIKDEDFMKRSLLNKIPLSIWTYNFALLATILHKYAINDIFPNNYRDEIVANNFFAFFLHLHVGNEYMTQELLLCKSYNYQGYF